MRRTGIEYVNKSENDEGINGQIQTDRQSDSTVYHSDCKWTVVRVLKPGLTFKFSTHTLIFVHFILLVKHYYEKNLVKEYKHISA